MQRVSNVLFQAYGPQHASPAATGSAGTASSAESRAVSGLRLARRIRPLRSLGWALAVPCVAAVFLAQHAHPLLWAALAFGGLAWPQLAYFVARNSADPLRAEYRSLLIDSALGAAVAATMQFNLLPSALILSMLAMDKTSAGGWRLLGSSFAVQLPVGLAVFALDGFRFHPATDLAEMLACMPLLLLYPIAVATSTHSLAARVRRQNRLLAEMNRIDPLTGLLNRGHWEEAVDAELRRHQRSGRPASLMMVDIDNFKPINDCHGHPAGDEVIRGVASLIQRGAREVDTAGRYGGDEFGIVLPETDLEQARVIAERIRREVQNGGFGQEGERQCTISIGMATVSADMLGSRDWIARADTALYRAKTDGRNCVAA